ncbi:Crocetin glucosyltransferase 2 [Acorus calamus]|uniref:Crocetin glucosyltransferase 2 n=1 Tax=Acorus calamus TaxID=4465 RepID=A0AAV9ENV7_ACOCL|nr:Crocetin glucosyltransferase 2 [Acorus calamus]
MATLLPVKTIGPTIPSMYLDNHHDKDDNSYGFSLFKPDLDSCVEWLDTKAARSVVYISFGSLAELGSEQTEELAHGLLGCGKPFIWVVRASEEANLPINFRAMTKEKGLSLIVRWCSQLEVLAHESVGCFISHCGWNSLLEAMSMGMPVVGVPLWTDQSTNAALVSEVWGTGVRVGVDGGGVARREELERCVRRVMEEEEFGRRVGEWRDFIRAAATTTVGGRGARVGTSKSSCPRSVWMDDLFVFSRIDNFCVGNEREPSGMFRTTPRGAVDFLRDGSTRSRRVCFRQSLWDPSG